MKIAISGATGYIGKHLTSFLTGQGHEITALKRNLFKEEAFAQLLRQIDGCVVIINLAGAPINKRWNDEYKQELYNSRVLVTRQLVKAISSLEQKPQLLISTSAVGYYSNKGIHDEDHNVRGQGFLANLCHFWEEEAKQCPPEVRTVIVRLGVVLSSDGGAMSKMLFPLKLTRTSTIIGSGKQAFPWIGLNDLCRAFAFIIDHPTMEGAFNITAPQLITQKYLAEALGRSAHALLTMSIPSIVFKILYGEGAAFLTSGQSVVPARLSAAGFNYQTPTIEELLEIPDHTTISRLDIGRYMGLWYEIARYENRFERGIENATAHYALQPDGTIQVENSGYKKEVLKRAIGRAKQPDKQQPGKLKVSFFYNFYSDYYILELDEKDYNYALIGSSSDNYLWILARTPQLPEETLNEILRKALARRYDTSKLIFTQNR